MGVKPAFIRKPKITPIESWREGMEKIALVLSIIFIILTFIGAGYVLYHGGRVNAGYAVVPMIFSIASNVFYHRIRRIRK